MTADMRIEKLKPPRQGAFVNHAKHWYSTVWNVPSAREQWIKDKLRAFLEFVRNLVVGLSFFLAAFALSNYIDCGHTAWRPWLVKGMVIASAVVCSVSCMSWSLSFSWPLFRWVIAILAMIIALICFFSVGDIQLWKDGTSAPQVQACSGKTLWGLLREG